MTVFWDWNGTIVDDVETVVKVNNEVFAAMGYDMVTTAETYRSLFRFPVIEYYMDLGIAAEDYPGIARAWNQGFVAAFPQVPLKKGVAEALRRFRAAGYRQVIVSASQQDQLRAQVALFPELAGMFDEVLGLSDVYAKSKIQLARDYLAHTGLDPREALFLGDTTHDAEVAKAIGCPCCLIAGGHQTDAVLAASGAKVVRGFDELFTMLHI